MVAKSALMEGEAGGGSAWRHGVCSVCWVSGRAEKKGITHVSLRFLPHVDRSRDRRTFPSDIAQLNYDEMLELISAAPSTQSPPDALRVTESEVLVRLVYALRQRCRSKMVCE